MGARRPRRRSARLWGAMEGGLSLRFGFLSLWVRAEQAQRAAGGRHAHGNGGSAPGCVAGGPGLAHRRTSDEGLRLSAAEAGSPARVQQVWSCKCALVGIQSNTEQQVALSGGGL